MIGLLKYRRLKNPCSNCLVRAACNKWCGIKYGYYEKRVRYLRSIKVSVAPVTVVLCLLTLAFLAIYYHQGSKDEIVLVIGLIMIVLIFVSGAYLDITYLHDMLSSAEHELSDVEFERKWV